MDIQDAYDLEINDSQFLDVHGDQNIHHHVRSVQVDGQNNSAIFHEDHRSTLDNRIINENCSNMVIYAQGQNCQVTLDAVDLPFLRNRNKNRERMSPNPTSPLKNGGTFDTLGAEGQNNARQTVTSNATYHQTYNSTTIGTLSHIVHSLVEGDVPGQMAVVEHGNDRQVHSGTGSARPSQPTPTSRISGAQPYRQGMPVRASPGPKDKPSVVTDNTTASSDQSASSCRAAGSHSVTGATARSRTSAPELTPLDVPSPSGSEELQRNTQVQVQSDVSGIPGKHVPQNQTTLMHRMLRRSTARSGASTLTPATGRSLTTEMPNQDQGTTSSDTRGAKAPTRKKSSLWFLRRGLHQMFTGWKNVCEKGYRGIRSCAASFWR